MLDRLILLISRPFLCFVFDCQDDGVRIALDQYRVLAWLEVLHKVIILETQLKFLIVLGYTLFHYY